MSNRENAYCSASNLCDTCECEHQPMRNRNVYCTGRGEYHPPVRYCGCYQPIKGLEPATKPVEPAQSQKRDESRDLWVYDGDLGATDYLRHSSLNEHNRWITNGERFVPHSQFEAVQSQITEARDLLSSLSSKLGAGLGDESRSLAEYVQGIEMEIDLHLRVADERVSAHLRVADERIATAQRDPELLDAILKAYVSESDFDEHDSALERAFENAIAERGKR